MQSETATHLDSFPIMKHDMERLYFNGERERGEREIEREMEMKGADRCLFPPLLSPFTIIDCSARLN